MKKTTKIIIGISACILVIVITALINLVPMFFMNPVETGEIENTGVLSIKNRVNNLFLIPTTSGYIAVDAGSDAKAVKAGLDQLGISSDEVKHVLLTHSDSDHTAALTIFTKAQVYMCNEEIPVLDGTTRRNFMGGNSLPDRVELDAITFLSDGEELSIDEHMFLCIRNAGHTPGSMSFFWADKYLFTGDAFQIKENEIKIHPYTMDDQKAKESIELLKPYIDRSDYIFTAHYGYYSPKDKK